MLNYYFFVINVNDEFNAIMFLCVWECDCGCFSKKKLLGKSSKIYIFNFLKIIFDISTSK